MDNEDEDFFNRLGVLMKIGIYLFKINRHYVVCVSITWVKSLPV
jgi:hypothetical protein